MTSHESDIAARIREMLRDGYIKLGGPASPDAQQSDLHVRMVRGYIPVSLEQLVDAGAMAKDDARAQGWTPPPPMPWRRRARWRWAAWRERAGRTVGGWIAGVDLSEREEEW